MYISTKASISVYRAYSKCMNLPSYLYSGDALILDSRNTSYMFVGYTSDNITNLFNEGWVDGSIIGDIVETMDIDAGRAPK